MAVNPILEQGIEVELTGLRTHLLRLAYRMLGDWAEAEDATQDVLSRWLTTPIQGVQDKKAYLSRMVINRCKATFRTLRQHRLNAYDGPWLPEPELQPDPDDNLEVPQQMSMGLMYLMERLTASERAVFVLRESYHMPFEEIADLLQLSIVNCRQLLSRGRRKLKQPLADIAPAEPQKLEQIATDFLIALDNTNLEALLKLLAPNVVLISDGGGKASAARVPVLGASKVAGFFNKLASLGQGQFTAKVVPVNGQPCAIIIEIATGLPISLLSFELNDAGEIQNMYAIRNPDKLKYVASVCVTN